MRASESKNKVLKEYPYQHMQSNLSYSYSSHNMAPSSVGYYYPCYIEICRSLGMA